MASGGHQTKNGAISQGKKFLDRQDEIHKKRFCDNGLCYLGFNRLLSVCKCDERLAHLE